MSGTVMLPIWSGMGFRRREPGELRQFEQFDLNVGPSWSGRLLPIAVEPDGVPANGGHAGRIV